MFSSSNTNFICTYYDDYRFSDGRDESIGLRLSTITVSEKPVPLLSLSVPTLPDMSLIANVLGFGAFGVAVRTLQLGIQKKPIFTCKYERDSKETRILNERKNGKGTEGCDPWHCGSGGLKQVVCRAQAEHMNFSFGSHTL